MAQAPPQPGPPPTPPKKPVAKPKPVAQPKPPPRGTSTNPNAPSNLTPDQIAWYRREIADGSFENFKAAWGFYRSKHKTGLSFEMFMQQLYGAETAKELIAEPPPKKKPQPKSVSADDFGVGELDSLALGAEDALDEPLFLDFVAPTFMPASDRVAHAHMDEWAQGILERDLTPEERHIALRTWRNAEKKFYNSEVRKARAEHARDIYQLATEFGQGVREDLGETQVLGAEGEFVIPSEAIVSTAKKRMKDFKPFDDEDLELSIKQAIARLAPEEEFGTELRDAMSGVVSAIRGQVSVQSFMP